MPAIVPDIAPVLVTAESPCAHCSLPVGSQPVRRGEAAFCCTGCAVVYEALGAAGFGETYYRLRELPTEREATRPVAPDALQVRELDTPEFLDTHTRRTADDQRVGELFVDGVHCAACVWLVEQLPYHVEGVIQARLDLPRARLRLTFDDGVRLSAVADWLARFGYALRPARTEALGQRTDAERRLLVRLGVAWALAGNVMLLAFALYAGLDRTGGDGLATAARWISLALAVPAVTYGAAPFFRRASASLRAAWGVRDLRRLHMDTPIALGIAIGFGHSAWATITGQGEVWFDSITVLIAALLTARWLQLRSRRLAGEASERLLALVPTITRRVCSDGTVEAVRVDRLRRGDLVMVPAGEVVPVDGTVTGGASRLNNAVLTGESRPEPVRLGDRVEAGATNLSAPLRLRVERVGEATRVGQLLAWVRDAEARCAPAVLLADRIGGVFVLAVVALALGTALLWSVLDPAAMPHHVVALLVITCPCALGMATPLVFTVAAGRAARAGLFVKSDEAVQRLTEVDAVVLDKTGTLTEGRMVLTALEGDLGLSPEQREEALGIAAALETESTHPIAEALVREQGNGRYGAPTAFESVDGCGVRGVVGGREVWVGRPDWIAAEVGPPSPPLAAAWSSYTRQGHTPVGVAVDGCWALALAVGDALRDDAHALVQQLQDEGKGVHILSGDHPVTVATVAAQLGIDLKHAVGGASPEAKREAVTALQQEGRTVLMVGDGVNDIAALQSADVGVAVGGGSTAGLVAADVFLTHPGLAPIAALLDGAHSAMRTVRGLLAFALAYNLVGAGAAVAGLVTPLVAAVAMPLSSLTVVALALLQPSFRRSRGGSS